MLRLLLRNKFIVEYIMNTLYSALVGFIIFLLVKNYKYGDDKEKPSNKECMMYAACASAVVYGCLSMYEERSPPVLKEPFISSLES